MTKHNPTIPTSEINASPPLVHYDAARRALALARDTDEVRKIRNKAQMMHEYARLAKDKDLEIDAAEIRLRAERRLGELIAEQKKTVGLNKGAKGSIVTGTKRAPVKDTRPTLADAGIDKRLSSRSQKLAALPEHKFESEVKQWRVKMKDTPDRITLPLSTNGSSSKAKHTKPAVIDEPFSPAVECWFAIEAIISSKFYALDSGGKADVVELLEQLCAKLQPYRRNRP